MQKDIFDKSLGAIDSPEDYRDVVATSVLGEPDESAYPDKFINRVRFDAFDQKSIGSCVGQASAMYKRVIEYAEDTEDYDLSARFIYAMCKSRDGIPETSGTYPRVAMDVLLKEGISSNDTFKTNNSLQAENFKDHTKISDQAFEQALQFRIKSYARVGSFLNVPRGDLMQAIYETHGVLMSFRVGSTWTRRVGRKRPEMPIQPPASVTGGHLVYIYGYEVERDGRLKLYGINSWGDDWGDDGHFELYYEDHFPFIKEAWTVVDLPNDYKDRDLPPAQEFAHTFNTDMREGQTSEEVRKLQIALAIEGVWGRPDIKATGYYGPITSRAVLAFWEKHNVATWWERTFLKGKSAGPKTRAKLNEIFSKKNDPNPPTPGSKLDAWAEAIQWYEGWFTPSQMPPRGSRSYRQNNPGNLRYSPFEDDNVDNFSVFNDYATGLKALKFQLTIAGDGRSRVYRPDMTLIEFFSKYAPSSDNNYPVKYATAVAGRMGVSPETKISELI